MIWVYLAFTLVSIVLISCTLLSFNIFYIAVKEFKAKEFEAAFVFACIGTSILLFTSCITCFMLGI